MRSSYAQHCLIRFWPDSDMPVAGDDFFWTRPMRQQRRYA
jgi:hypothetical protein